MRKPIAYVDMDDTLCQYRKAHNEQRTVENIYPQSKENFFRNLKPIIGAIDGINKLTEYYDVWILTRPSIYNPYSYTEKRLWIEDHLGFEWCKKLIINPDKTLMKSGLLIDDVDWKIYGFVGPQFLFGSKEYPDWTAVINKVIKINKI